MSVRFHAHRCHGAFSLVEVVLGLGIAAFCLVLVFGLLPVGLDSNQTATEQTNAVGIAGMITADLRQATRPPQATLKSPRYQLTVPTPGVPATPATLFLRAGGDNTGSAAPTSDSRYKATITLTAPASGERGATIGHIVVSWPAAATNPAGTIETFVALDRN